MAEQKLAGPPELASQHCASEAKRLPTLRPARRRALHAQVPEWHLGPTFLSRTWKLEDFAACLRLANRIGEVAEREQHHPDLHLESYKTLRAVLSTHAAGGLTQNDFILAARIDRLPEAPGHLESRPKRGKRPGRGQRRTPVSPERL